MASAADDGRLYLEPGVARGCAQRCTDLIAELRSIRSSAQRLSTMDGFGTLLPSGVALTAKFEGKASGADNSLDQVLDKHMTVVEQMRDLFTKIGAQYQATEGANQQSLTNVDAGF
ncbi:hypothetical protein HUN07_09705 [Rhodococcus sp. W8901]|nr:hypothetical protein HUN07_09705 [Rhodococcus sp. W8901]